MADHDRRDPAVRLLVQLIVSTGVWLVTYLFCTSRLAAHDDPPAVRGAIVAVGIAGLLPWVFLTAKAIRGQDEFTRQLRYLALAIAFGVTAVGSFVVDFLHRARLIGEWPITGLWMAMLVIWALTMFAVSRYYR
jgi:hypothetical protein